MTGALSRFMVVSWRDLPRWDLKTARASAFRLAHPGFRPLGDFAEEATELVQPWKQAEHEWPVYGVNNEAGVVFSHHQRGDTFNAPYKRIQKDWFFHNPTRANVGSLGRVPDVPEDAITSPEYQVWRITRDLLPAYVDILIQTPFFIEQIAFHRVGAVKERLFVQNLLEIPIPVVPLPVQRKIVAEWDKARKHAATTAAKIDKLERDIEARFLADLGLKAPQAATLPKAFAVPWKDLERWSVRHFHMAATNVDLTSGRYPIVAMRECLVETMNGYCIKPVSGPTPHKMLKLSALRPGGLDLSESKYINVSEKTVKRFRLCKGDLLICRSVGSFDHIAKCALVESDEPAILYPDIIIRARFNAKMLPEYARQFIQTKAGRTYFQQNARTAVGMWKIGGDDIANLPIPLPPMSVQRKIVDDVAKQRTGIAKLKAEAKVRADVATADVEAMILGTKPVG
jgi:type I restriction enzyme, S subunit